MVDAVTLQHKKILLKTPVLSIPQVLHVLLGFTQSCWLELPGYQVLGMEVWDPRDPPHNQAKFKALPLLGSDQGTGASSEQMGCGRAESENILADQAEQKHGCGEVRYLSNLAWTIEA
jgi:hypothetical protein